MLKYERHMITKGVKMEFFKTFFRGNEDGYIFPMYGKVHILMLAIFFVGIYFIYKGYLGIKDEKRNNKFMNTMLAILFIDQIVLYAWQIGSGYFNWEMSLPLYHCRICVWFLIIGIYFDKPVVKTIGLYWGALGSLLAMLVPDLYDFSFPHYTNIQFFIVHILMGWVISDLIFRKKYIPGKNENIKALIFTNFFNLALIIFDISMRKYWPKVNYGYMLELPVANDLLPNSIQPLIMFLMFNFVMLVFAGISTLASNKRKNAYEEIDCLFK